MKNSFLVLALLLNINSALQAQELKHCHRDVASANRTGSGSLSTGHSGTGANVNVLYHRAEWNVDPNAAVVNINGTVTTYFKTLLPNVSVISFDFNKYSFKNASLHVTYHGAACVAGFATTGNVLNITLPGALTETGTLDSVSITYSGTPVRQGFSGGFPLLNYVDQSGNTQNYIVTLSESYEDKDWWPCKADMQDKIDSMDIIVTVPWAGADTFWVAGNGTLVDSVIHENLRTFTYSTRYPMASYLVGIAVAKYNRYYSSVQVGNTSVPVYWYLLAGNDNAYYTDAIAAMTKMNRVLQAYSSKFGDYPFKKEKHGYYDGLDGAGGMEHQTFSAIASNSITSLATLDHELTHQWFGDNVTFATWNDLWLAEGLARYGEILAAELLPALGYNAYVRRMNIRNAALSINNYSLWIPDNIITDSYSIWNSGYGSAVYERGCMVVSMLRTICGDAKFFQALGNYQNTLAGKAASADSLKRFFNEVLGTDLSNFFNDYVGGSGNAATAVGGIGNPVYQIKWNSPEPNKLLLGVASQSRTAGSNVTYFHGPVVVRVTGSTPATQDTTIVFYDWGNRNLSYAGNGVGVPVSGNMLTYHLSFTPVAIRYDDSARTLSTGSAILDTAFKGYIWYGADDMNWFNPANWSACCGVPPAGADITIATLAYSPVLSSDVTAGNLTINAGKVISIGSNTLTVNGSMGGSGSITGSAASRLVIAGKAGLLNFTQNINTAHKLQSLQLLPGSAAVLTNDLEVNNLNVSSAARLTVTAGVNLTTH